MLFRDEILSSDITTRVLLFLVMLMWMLPIMLNLGRCVALFEFTRLRGINKTDYLADVNKLRSYHSNQGILILFRQCTLCRAFL